MTSHTTFTQDKVQNWPMSLAPTTGESGDLCKKTSQKEEKNEAFCKRKCFCG